jgi:alpha-glucosidase (family GH31 glycosyl hydrolase)
MRRATSITVLAALLLAFAAAAPLNDLKPFGYQPLANPGAIVTSGNARFTVLSNYLIRMEYSASATFEDRATLAIVNRKTTTPSFTQTTGSNGALNIQTSGLTLTYQPGQPFTAASLTATMSGGGNWYWGQQDNQNLLGTIKSLDELCNPTLNCTQNANYRVHSESLHCTWGVVSRGGWTTYDDSGNYILSGVEGQWFDVGLKSVSDVDVYLFAHGTDYKAAVFDLMQIAGKQQLTHKHLLGSWYTRWFDFDNDDVQRIIQNYKDNRIPLDVLILDMNWHTKFSWTGYSWDKTLFPVPSDTIAFLKSQGLKVGANLHDAVGFGYWEDGYTTMATAMGLDPNTQNTVIFQPLNETYMHTMEDSVLKELGFDVWWIDWQQGGNFGGCTGEHMNPTFITDHVRSTDPIRRGENVRGNILARWGGMGTQRYPVGFSGDVSQLSWECFAYQPYFVATAANVGYGTISNDLVGPPNDHELHTRWMQFGAFSPIMRIHDRGMSSGSCWGSGSCGIVDLWYLPSQYLDAIREAMIERSALQPYIYTMTRATYDTGLALVRPMYYEFPSHSSAYQMSSGGNAQYMFGNDMFVAPITTQSQMACADGCLVQSSVWLPPGTWYDEVFGELVSGDTTTNQLYTIYDVPRFVRAGAVIPRVSNPTDTGVAGTTYPFVDWRIYPGSSSGSGRMYEDDGSSLDYITGGFAYTTASYSVSGTTVTVTVSASNGSYTGQPTSRNFRIVLVGVLPLSSATLNSNAVSYVRFPTLGQVSHTYDGKSASVIIDVGSQSTASSFTVTATFVQQDTSPSATARMKVFAHRAALAKRTTDDYQMTPFETTPGPGYLKQAAARAGYISAVVAQHPSIAPPLMGQPYLNLINLALAELGGSPGPTPMPSPTDVIVVQLYSHQRGDTLLCASVACIATNMNYQILFMEGYQPAATEADATTLYDYFSESSGDNWATTSSSPPATGYSAAIFDDGLVLSQAGPNRACLNVYYLESTGDHLTTAAVLGQQWATEFGYTLNQTCVGYVYVNEPTSGGTKQATQQEAAQYVARVRKEHVVAKAQGAATEILGAKKVSELQTALTQQADGHKKPKTARKLGDGPFGDADPTSIAIQYLQSLTG